MAVNLTHFFNKVQHIQLSLLLLCSHVEITNSLCVGQA